MISQFSSFFIQEKKWQKQNTTEQAIQYTLNYIVNGCVQLQCTCLTATRTFTCTFDYVVYINNNNNNEKYSQFTRYYILYVHNAIKWFRGAIRLNEMKQFPSIFLVSSVFAHHFTSNAETHSLTRPEHQNRMRKTELRENSFFENRNEDRMEKLNKIEFESFAKHTITRIPLYEWSRS